METTNNETTNWENTPANENSGIVEAATCSSCGQQNAGVPANAPGRPNSPVQPNVPAKNYIYAIGRIESKFPGISIEKEFAQLLGSTDTKGLPDREAFHKVLSNPQNIYIARQLCWVMSIAGVDTYIVIPRNPADLGLLIESVRPQPDHDALDAIIGIKGPIATPDMCNGLTLPIAFIDHMYSFDRKSLLASIPVPKDANKKEFEKTAAEVLDRILASTDNAGATDTQRALNYLALRDPGIYARSAECFSREMALTSIETRPWRLSTVRKVVEVIFTFTQRKNEFVEKYITRVDVNDEFPFLGSKMAPFYEH